MPDPTIITSDSILPDINRHFRVSAGPGAGKTYWLTKHIRHVAATSPTLGPTQRIACISYTNVAAGEIVERLGKLAWRVDASTIHSFLYRNLVHPYLWVLHDDKGAHLVNFGAVEGHQEHQPIRQFVKTWLNSVSTSGAYLVNELLNKNGPETLDYLREVRWKYDLVASAWKIVLPKRKPPRMLPVRKLAEYKPQYWTAGIIDHDDVLFFAHRLLDENPPLRSFLAARFPYVFIDEFQDTNPVQTRFIKWLAESGSVVGVVGDAQQAIFGFQGASRDAFMAFGLSGHVDYWIADNRRSTKQIVTLLNRVRLDNVQQKATRCVDGPAVEVLVGPATKSVEHVESENHTTVLARTNTEVAALRARGPALAPDPWATFRWVDSASGRAVFWERLLSACELARGKRFGESVNTLARAVCHRGGSVRKPFNYVGSLTSVQRDGVAVAVIERLLQNLDDILDMTVADAYSVVADAVARALPGLTMQGYARGKPKAFAKDTSVRTLISAVVIEDETRRCRTIHKAKSAEFDAVLVCLKDQGCLDHILAPERAQDEEGQEEQRITYVALSRARDRLVISVPALSAEREAAIAGLSIMVTRLP
jgi:DNA helicase-2/ATP-dependent DNA helicase PcrA